MRRQSSFSRQWGHLFLLIVIVGIMSLTTMTLAADTPENNNVNDTNSDEIHAIVEEESTTTTTDPPTASPVRVGGEDKNGALNTNSPTAAPVEPDTDQKANTIVCADAQTCLECQNKAQDMEAIINDENQNTCAWGVSISGGEDLSCNMVPISSIADRSGDQCGQTTTTGQQQQQQEGPGADTANQDKPTNGDSQLPGGAVVVEPESSNGGIIIGVIVFLIIGVVGWKIKGKLSQRSSGPAHFGGGMGGMGGMGGLGGSGAKGVKYQQVAVDETDDEEWGWGDDDDGGGEFELATSNKDDSSVHKRRTPSNESLPGAPSSSAASPSSSGKLAPTRTNSITKGHPAAVTTSSFNHTPKTTFANHSIGSKSTLPTAPSSVPSSGIGYKGTSNGLQLSRPPAVLSSPATAPVPTTTMSMPTNPDYPAVGGMQITSLGPARKKGPTPNKKPAAQPEEDIFASMGLSAKPEFSHTPAAKPKAQPVQLSGSRWATTPTTPITTATASTLAAAAAAPSSANASGDDDNWGDDDLDDLIGE